MLLTHKELDAWGIVHIKQTGWSDPIELTALIEMLEHYEDYSALGRLYIKLEGVLTETYGPAVLCARKNTKSEIAGTFEHIGRAVYGADFPDLKQYKVTVTDSPKKVTTVWAASKEKAIEQLAQRYEDRDSDWDYFDSFNLQYKAEELK